MTQEHAQMGVHVLLPKRDDTDNLYVVKLPSVSPPLLRHCCHRRGICFLLIHIPKRNHYRCCVQRASGYRRKDSGVPVLYTTTPSQQHARANYG